MKESIGSIDLFWGVRIGPETIDVVALRVRVTKESLGLSDLDQQTILLRLVKR